MGEIKTDQTGIQTRATWSSTQVIYDLQTQVQYILRYYEPGFYLSRGSKYYMTPVLETLWPSYIGMYMKSSYLSIYYYIFIVQGTKKKNLNIVCI